MENKLFIKSLANEKEFKDFAIINKTFGMLLNEADSQYGPKEIAADGRRRITFGQLRNSVDQFAKGLLRLGIKHGDRVVILMPNSIDWMIAAFALAKLGAIIVTCNTRLKPVEIEHVIKLSEASAVILVDEFVEAKVNYIDMLTRLSPEIEASAPGMITSSVFPNLKNIIVLGPPRYSFAYSFLHMFHLGEDLNDEFLKSVESKVSPEDVAVIIFTSGTTGLPKGCKLKHFSLITTTWSINRAFYTTEQDVLSMFIPFFSVYGTVVGLISPLLTGAREIITPVFEPGKSLELIDKEKVSLLLIVPTMAIMMLNHPDFAKYDVFTLRTGNIGGSPVPPEVMGRVLDNKAGFGMGCNAFSVFGLTETCSGITAMVESDSVEKRLTTVGRAIPGVDIKIIDPKTGNDLSWGEEGEILVRGYCLMEGYYNNPEATSARIKNGWLYTGDLGIADQDGYLKITGRLSDLIIVGGFNVYPKEIEDLLISHSKIENASVIGVPDSVLGEIPFAYIIPRQGAELTKEEVISFCKQNISNYKVPKYVEFVDSFPLNAIGKVQKFIQREQAIKKFN